MSAPVSLQLFTTAGCHLCAQLEATLAQLGAQVVLERVEVADEAVWVARYALRIPVLKTSAGEEYSFAEAPQMLPEWLTMQGVELVVTEVVSSLEHDAEAPESAVMRNGRRFLN